MPRCPAHHEQGNHQHDDGNEAGDQIALQEPQGPTDAQAHDGVGGKGAEAQGNCRDEQGDDGAVRKGPLEGPDVVRHVGGGDACLHVAPVRSLGEDHEEVIHRDDRGDDGGDVGVEYLLGHQRALDDREDGKQHEHNGEMIHTR